MRVVNKNKDSFTHYIGRGSVLGNPFTHLPLAKTKAVVQVATLDDSITSFEEWLRGNPRWVHVERERRLKALAAIRELPEDAVLGCYCRPKRCHGDPIMAIWKEMHEGILSLHGRRRFVWE